MWTFCIAYNYGTFDPFLLYVLPYVYIIYIIMSKIMHWFLPWYEYSVVRISVKLYQTIYTFKHYNILCGILNKYNIIGCFIDFRWKGVEASRCTETKITKPYQRYIYSCNKEKFDYVAMNSNVVATVIEIQLRKLVMMYAFKFVLCMHRCISVGSKAAD